MVGQAPSMRWVFVILVGSALSFTFAFALKIQICSLPTLTLTRGLCKRSSEFEGLKLLTAMVPWYLLWTYFSTMWAQSLVRDTQVCVKTYVSTRIFRLRNIEVDPHEDTLASHIHIINAQLGRHFLKCKERILRWYFEPNLQLKSHVLPLWHTPIV